MGHYDECREGYCGICGQTLVYCSCSIKEEKKPSKEFLILKKEMIRPEHRKLRERLFKQIMKSPGRNDPNFAADVVHWLYVDLLLNNFNFESCMEMAKGSKDTIEITARRHFKREN